MPDTTPNPIDIVVSFDTTGSMQAAIAQVRREVTALTIRLFKEVPNLHLGVITHGDYCDGPDFMTVQDLTDNQALLCDFIKTAPNTGGGDCPEAYEAVLSRARSLKWRSGHAKVLVLIGDDVPHGPSYPQNKLRLDWKNELGLLKEAGIHVYAVQALARHHATSFYAEVAKMTDGVHLDLHQFSAVLDLILAVCYNQVSPEAVAKYEEEVIKAGRLTDSTGAMFDILLARPVRVVHAAPASSGYHTTSPRRSSPAAKGAAVKVAVEAVDEAALKPVPPSRFQVLTVDKDTPIKDFAVANGCVFKTGRGFYEFTKSVEIQRYKEIVLMNTASGAMWTGDGARKLLGLPDDKTVTLRPGSLPGYVAFIQSTSNNRKLLAGTKFLYEMDDYDRVDAAVV